MATNIREISLRIKATKKTAQITNAMDMISKSKLKKIESSIKSYVPYLNKIQDVVSNIMANIDETKEFHNILIDQREIKKICYVIITTDKGLVGSFNNNLYKKLEQTIKENNHLDYVVSPLGLKGYRYLKKQKHPIYEDKYIYVRDDVEFNELIPFIKNIIKGYVLHDFDMVKVIYNSYINSIKQEVLSYDLLPLTKALTFDKVNKDYEFDGNIEDMLNMILPIYIENILYGLVLNSKASEHATRMNSMKNATDNALEIVDKLQLIYNRARQQAITLEITDIVSGANVVDSK